MPNFRKAQEATRAAHNALENIEHMYKALFNEKLIQASEAYKQAQQTEQEMRAQITGTVSGGHFSHISESDQGMGLSPEKRSG